MAMFPDDYTAELKKAFDIQARDMQYLFIQILRLRYITGTIPMTEFIGSVKHTMRLITGKEMSDLDLTEQVEGLNVERDAFYKRIIDGAKDLEKSNKDNTRST